MYESAENWGCAIITKLATYDLSVISLYYFPLLTLKIARPENGLKVHYGHNFKTDEMRGIEIFIFALQANCFDNFCSILIKLCTFPMYNLEPWKILAKRIDITITSDRLD
jgi:hypothetical protein